MKHVKRLFIKDDAFVEGTNDGLPWSKQKPRLGVLAVHETDTIAEWLCESTRSTVFSDRWPVPNSKVGIEPLYNKGALTEMLTGGQDSWLIWCGYMTPGGLGLPVGYAVLQAQDHDDQTAAYLSVLNVAMAVHRSPLKPDGKPHEYALPRVRRDTPGTEAQKLCNFRGTITQVIEPYLQSIQDRLCQQDADRSTRSIGSLLLKFSEELARALGRSAVKLHASKAWLCEQYYPLKGYWEVSVSHACQVRGRCAVLLPRRRLCMQ